MMPNSKTNNPSGSRRTGSVEEKSGNRGGGDRARLISGKSSSFNSQSVAEGAMAAATRLQRPKTVQDLRRVVGERQEGDERPRLLTKLLLNVTIQGSLGPMHVVMRPESTVEDLIVTAVAQYVKEGRRPVPPNKDPAAFDLHYSQFSLESIVREEKLLNLGSRNFFLCKKRNTNADRTCLAESSGGGRGRGCSKEAEKAGFNWLRFMELLL
ncbi:hypothetical protein MLD38_040195 [Melastoma candidum]|uniref:Uncharacterized protein n=1 Tax=Melastoma candidum TaxID=119954 RepID=A0ACB9L4H1_9MYRT|nr:hypothetical protein MLD38_040195 [Melastoma candidum]